MKRTDANPSGRLRASSQCISACGSGETPSTLSHAMDFHITAHAEAEMARRRIPRQMVEDILRAPQQIAPTYGGRRAYQSRVEFREGRLFLVRVIVDARFEPLRVITVYRTSKIEKYWVTK